MNPKRQWPVILLTIFTLSACEPDTGEGAEESSDDEEVAAIPVEIAIPTRGDIHASYSGTAPIEAFADATVIAKAGGEVREILSGDAASARVSISRDLLISQFWQNLHSILHPAVAIEYAFVPGR